jgi:hypothetical protein
MDKIRVSSYVQLSTGMNERMRIGWFRISNLKCQQILELTGSPLMIVWLSEPSPRRRLRSLKAESPISLPERVVTTCGGLWIHQEHATLICEWGILNAKTSAEQCLINFSVTILRPTSSFTLLFPHTAEEPRTEKQSKARMADGRIFILKKILKHLVVENYESQNNDRLFSSTQPGNSFPPQKNIKPHRNSYHFSFKSFQLAPHFTTVVICRMVPVKNYSEALSLFWSTIHFY